MKNMKIFIMILALPILFTSCGQKSGSTKATEKTQERVTEPTHEELNEVEAALGVFWNDLSSIEVESWNSDSSIFRRSVVFGYHFSKMNIKTKLIPLVINDEEIESIFLSFNQAIEEMGQPDINSLAKKLLTKKAVL
jgi:hypothetical protein